MQINHLASPMGAVLPLYVSWEGMAERLCVECDGKTLLDMPVQGCSASLSGAGLPAGKDLTFRVLGGNGEQSCHVLLDMGCPQGEWISCPDTKGDVLGAGELRSTFQVRAGHGRVRKALVRSTALGLYQLFLNGKRVADREFMPGFTSYDHRILYQTMDATELVQDGSNEIRCLLGNGWYRGEMGFLHNRNNYGDRTALLLEMTLEYEDGTVDSVKTGSEWQSRLSQILESEIYLGETADGRENPRPWGGVDVLDAPEAELVSDGGCANRVEMELDVVRVLHTPKGETVADFGQNLTGNVSLRVHGRAGEKVELQCFEVLDRDGNVYTDNLRTARCRVSYILSGDGEETWNPWFSFQGFRYVQILSWPGNFEPEQLRARVIHFDMPVTGKFQCSSPELTRLMQNICWSLRGNSLDIPTDCPQRDERVGWTGDAQIFSAAAPYFMDVYAFFSKWMRDVVLDQKADGGIPHVVPDLISGRPQVRNDWLLSQGTWGAAGWADVITILPWNLYRFYGDPRILEECFPAMLRHLDFMRSRADGCVWNYLLQFGDWVALDAEEGSYFGKTPADMTCACYYTRSTDAIADAAHVLGREETEQEMRKLAAELRQDYVRRFFRDGHLTVQTQTAQILTLVFGLCPDEWRENLTRDLIALIQARGGHLDTGFMGTPLILEALSANGRAKEAMDLLMNPTYPGWLYQVTRGATTIWEHWDGIKPDGSMWSPDMNSMNHYAYGTVGQWIWNRVAGLEMLEPGWKRFRLAPLLLGLDCVQAELQTPMGRIRASWEIHEKTATVNVTVPEGCVCEACLPGSCDESGLLRAENGCLTATLQPGSWEMRISLA